MKRILVVYYTQSGQLKQIIDSILSPISSDNEYQIDFECLQPDPEYPFPWGKHFFSFFPESVKGIPCKLKPFRFNPESEYDLVILGYQSWYLSPSIPIWSFLQTEKAAEILKAKKVLTIIGARNMWICSQEIIARKLKDLKARLVGNIVLTDQSSNYISSITIIRWLIKGKKSATLLLPEAGVSNKDITNASIFGNTIRNTLINNSWDNLQSKLINDKAVSVKYHLLKIEKNARKIFDKFAGYVLKKGQAGDPRRKRRLVVFKYYLLFMIFVVSPFASLIFKTVRVIFYQRINKIILYYSDIALK